VPVPGEAGEDDDRILRKAHWAIEKVGADLGGGRFAFNTAISAVMELVNELGMEKRGAARDGTVRFALATACSLLFPFAPHAAADGWHRLTGGRVWEEPWPEADPAWRETATFELVVQVNGKARARIEAPADATKEQLIELARAQPNAQQHLDGKEVVKEIVVPGRLVNIVVRG
jgi:leucyl-tRNA synthetase